MIHCSTIRERPHELHRTLARVIAVALLLTVAVPCAAQAAQTSGFPRIAIWWPDADAQSATSLAKCDWIALQSYDAAHIAPLRALNPNIYVLGSTSARELNYSLSSHDSPANVELRTASTDWMLTQVGSRLTGDVSAGATSIPVSDTSKFAVGEMALVDHELVHVAAVGSGRLTVTDRGIVTTAASHGAGARIASVVSHWPRSISMDLSTNCSVRDVGHGPETWSDWSVRRATSELNAADWDGLLIDCLESDIRWMVTNGDVRSIDPDRSNIAVADGYSAFNASWSEGAAAYGSALRAASGDKILIGNNNMRNFALNGIVFEEYPYEGLSLTNWNTVFIGPFAYPRASYPEWCTGAASPNLTTFQTYGAATNYQLMRYGLCSTLMDDGYFSYAKSSTGHARNGVWWYDEYDNAGAGRGYLGTPVGDATKVGGAWRRDFTSGIALVNPTSGPVTVDLGGTFGKIRGTQDPEVNNGKIVTSVTIPSRDGIILLRVPTATLCASVAVLPYGQETTLTASIVPVQSARIQLERRAVGKTLWKVSAAPTLDANGAAQVVRSPEVTTDYRVLVEGTAVVSKAVRVSVRPRLSLHVSSLTVRAGSSLRLYGTITHPGRVPILLQRRSGGVWRTVRRMVTSSAGRYSTRVHFSKRGTFTYRVRATADASHLTAVSGAASLVVR